MNEFIAAISGAAGGFIFSALVCWKLWIEFNRTRQLHSDRLREQRERIDALGKDVLAAVKARASCEAKLEAAKERIDHLEEEIRRMAGIIETLKKPPRRRSKAKSE